MNDTPIPPLQPGQTYGSNAINAQIARTNSDRLFQGDQNIMIGQMGGARTARLKKQPNLVGASFFQVYASADGSGTYTVLDTAGNPLGTGVSAANTPQGSYTTAQGYIDLNGILHIWGGQTPGLICKVLTAATKNGAYNGVLLTPPTADIVDTGTLAETDFGVIPSVPNAYILNNQEIGSATHYITTNTANNVFVFPCTFIRMESTGIARVAITGVFPGC